MIIYHKTNLSLFPKKQTTINGITNMILGVVHKWRQWGGRRFFYLKNVSKKSVTSFKNTLQDYSLMTNDQIFRILFKFIRNWR
jgi:hypothetical protein